MNVVDSLVVTLGLDSSKFTQGQKKLREDLKSSKESANAAAKEIAASGATAAQYFGKLRNEALALAGVMLGGMGIKAFVGNLTTADAQLGRVSRNLGISTELLSAWGQVAARNGGSAEGMVSAFQALNEQLQIYNRTGQSSITPLLQRLGVNSMSELEDLPRVLTKIAGTLNDEIASGRTTRGQAVSLLSGLGLDPGIINAMLSGTKRFAEQLREALKLGVPSEKDTNAAIALEQAFKKTQQAAIHLGRTILTQFTPAVTAALEDVDKWLSKDENREWLNAKITEAVVTIKEFAIEVNNVVTALGGWKVVTEVLFALWIGSKFLKVIANMTRLLGLLAAIPGSGVTAAMLTRLGIVTLPLALKGDTADNPQAREAEQAAREGHGDQWRRDNPNLGERLWNWMWGPSGGSGGGAPRGGPGGGPRTGSWSGRISDQAASESQAFWESKGLTPAQAAGMAAQEIAESGGNPAARGDYVNGQATAIGLHQWHADRRAAILKGTGIDINTATAAQQREAAFWELTKGQEQAAWRTIQGARTAAEAGRAATGYERPGLTPEVQEQERANRAALAERLLRERARRLAPNGVPATGPAFGPLAPMAPPVIGLPDPSVRPRAGPRADRISTSDNSRREMSVGTIMVHTAATDAKGIVRGIGPALEHAFLASQANFGLA